MKDYRDVLVAPVVSEKSYGLLDENKYTFIVSPDANKTEIKIAVEKVFGVKVLSVNTMNRHKARNCAGSSWRPYRHLRGTGFLRESGLLREKDHHGTS
jgi:large subunit ribosomal protein L23